ncbi:MAG: hypothetical protein ACM3NJ_00890 [Methanobacterium sp.]
MLKRRMGMFNQKRASVLIILAMLMSLIAVPSAFAFNASGDKSVNITGYQLDTTNRNWLKVYFDKNTSGNIHTDGSWTSEQADKWEFRVYDSSDNLVNISTVAASTGGGVDTSLFPGYPTGTNATLTFSSSLDYNTLYTVKVSKTIRANNNMTIGHVIMGTDGSKIDRQFKFKTPDSSGNYSGDPYISVMPLDNATSGNPGVPVEGNVGFIVDRPVTSASATEIVDLDNTNDMELYYTPFGGGTETECTYEDPNDSGDSGDVVEATYNIARTGFWFPLTWGGTGATSHDLDFDMVYCLRVPNFNCDNSASFTATNCDFATDTDPDNPYVDIPAKLYSTPTWNSGTNTISWSSVTGAASYTIYRSDNRYWDYDTVVATGVTGTSYVWSSPVSGAYIRIEPVNQGGKSGLSPYVQIP